MWGNNADDKSVHYLSRISKSITENVQDSI